MLNQATICAAVQRVARAGHESDDTAILARAVLQLLWDVERLRVDDRTLAGELRRTRSSIKKLRAKPRSRIAVVRNEHPTIRLRAK